MRFPVVNLGLKCAPGYVPTGDPSRPCMADYENGTPPVSPSPVPPPVMEANGQGTTPEIRTTGAAPAPPVPQPIPVQNVEPPPPAVPVRVSPVIVEDDGTRPRWVNTREGSLGTTLAATGTVAALMAAAALLFK